MISLSKNLSEVLISIGVFSFAAIKLMPSISQITSQYQLIKYNIPVVNILFQEIKKIKDNQKNLVSNENNFQNNFQNLKIVDLSFGYQNKRYQFI